MLKTFLSIFVLSCVLLVGCGKDSDIPGSIVATTDRTRQQTLNGAWVYSLNGVTDAQLAQVDAGLTEAFANGILSGWTGNPKAYNYSLYIIKIPVDPCVPSTLTQTPSFKVRGDNYDGSIYDQYNTKGELPTSQQNVFDKYVKDGVGVVFAAEQVLGFNTQGSTTQGQQNAYASFAVCSDEAVLQNGSEYGAEHAIVAHYDSEYFWLTQTHSVIGHPILPKRSTKNFDYYVPSKETKLPINEVVE